LVRRVRQGERHQNILAVGERAELQLWIYKLQRVRFGGVNVKSQNAKTGGENGQDDGARFHGIITAK
jgi:hypothetical protein